jgi:hypothetical protein
MRLIGISALIGIARRANGAAPAAGVRYSPKG